MTSSKTFLLIAIIAALGQSCSALFYTTSNKDEFPRIGKRLLQLTNIRKSPNELYRTTESEPQGSSYLWRSIPSSILPSDAVGDETLSDEDIYVLRKILRFPPRYASQKVQEHKNTILRHQQLQSLLENGLLPAEY